MRTHPIRHGAANTSTVVIVVLVVVLGGLLVLGCFGALLAGIMLPALGKAREATLDVRSMAQLRQIEFTYEIWQRDVEADAPFSFDALIAGNYAMPDLFASPHGPAPDGRGDYWLLHPRPDLEPEDLADLIVGYDRAMYATRPTVTVVLGNRTAEVLLVDDFEAQITHPPNDQIDFDLPQRRRQSVPPE